MGYLDGLFNCIFKKDSSGRTVFFPRGAAGKGRVLENAETESVLRAFLRRYYLASLLALISVPLLLGSGYPLLLLIPALHAGYLHKTGKILAQCPTSEEKLSLKEVFTAMADAIGELFLWALLAASLLICAAGLWIAFRAAEGTQIITGGAVTVVFGIFCAGLVYMISAKDARRQSGAGQAN